MQSMFVILAFSLSTSAFAGQLNVGYGSSVPADPTNQTLVSKKGISRANGGEHLVLKFAAAKTVTDIKLTGFSTSKKGSIVIHGATAENGGTKSTLDGLSVFTKVTAGNPANYKTQVQLSDSLFVDVQPNTKIGSLDISVEGFASDDASLLVQVTTAEALPSEDFMVTRSSSSETFGGLINEANFAKFQPADLASLMTRAAVPAANDLANRTFVCTSYSKLDAVELNAKKRTYYLNGSGLVSDSEAEGIGQTWTASAAGLELAIQNFNGCGHYQTTNVLRMTGAGNLISEVVLDLGAYVNLCASAGYDAPAVQAVEANSTFPSILNSKFVVNTYEFCRPSH